MYAGQIIDVIDAEDADRETIGLLMAGVRQESKASPYADQGDSELMNAGIQGDGPVEDELLPGEDAQKGAENG